MRYIKRYNEVREHRSTQVSPDELSMSLMRELLEDEGYITLDDDDNDGGIPLEEVEGAWKSFVDSQELGDCQSIVGSIKLILKYSKSTYGDRVKAHFGEIEVDEPYIDEYGEEQTLMTHHWITIDDEIYEYSKGTLKNYIDWRNLYSLKTEEWRYNYL